jgi:hypothetical protein
MRVDTCHLPLSLCSLLDERCCGPCLPLLSIASSWSRFSRSWTVCVCVCVCLSLSSLSPLSLSVSLALCVYTHTCTHTCTNAHPPTHTHTNTHTCGDEALVIAEVLDPRIPSISLSPPQPFHIGNCYLPGKLFLIRVFRPSLCPHHNHFILLSSSSSSSWTVKSCCLRI